MTHQNGLTISRRAQKLGLVLSCILATVASLSLAIYMVHGNVARADAINTTDFVTTWKTDNPGSSNDSSITIQTSGGGYNYDVDWNNDGTFDQTGLIGTVTHDFGTPGTYTIRIRGAFPRFQASNDADKLISVDQWGTNIWQGVYCAFCNVDTLAITATDAPNLSNITNTSFMFAHIKNLTGNFSGWNTSSVTNMSSMFAGVQNLTGDLSGWDTSNVTDMSSMFDNLIGGTSAINPDVSSWDISNVTSIFAMFRGDTVFDRNLSSWNTSNVTNMSSVFQDTAIFNQDITGWDTSNVTDMSYMFASTGAFDQNIGIWDTGQVTNMSGMFYGTEVFNQDLTGWDTSKVTSMADMFRGSQVFNQDITSWNTSSLINMFFMFSDAAAFNQDLSSLDVSHVTSMNGVFNASTSLPPAMGLSTANYDATLIGWASQSLQSNVTMDAGVLYCVAGAARQHMIDTFGWTINDYGRDCKAQINSSNTVSIGSNLPVGTEVGVLTTQGFTPRVTQPYGLTCSVPGADDAFFSVTSGDKIVLAYSLDSTNPSDQNDDNVYDICVRATNSLGQTIDTALTVHVTGVKQITSVSFNIDGGARHVLTVHGSSLVDESTSEYTQALSRSLVTLNGVALPFCSDGVGLTAQQMIDMYASYGYDLNGLVSDDPPCYFIIQSSLPALVAAQAIVWVPDNFDTTAEGTVSVNGSNTYTFNAGANPEAPTAMVNGDKPLTDHPTIPKRPTFSGVALPGSHVEVTIHSDPVTCTATADLSGNWSCTLPTDLDPGEHTVLVVITEPDSTVRTLGPYTVMVAADGSSVPLTPDTGLFRQILAQAQQGRSRSWMPVVVALVALVGCATMVVLIARRAYKLCSGFSVK